MFIKSNLWQLGVVSMALAFSAACSKKKDGKTETTPTESGGVVSGGGAGSTTPTKKEPPPLRDATAYESQVLPNRLSINFPAFLLERAPKGGSGLRLTQDGEAGSEEAAPLAEDVSVTTDGSTPNGANQLAIYAQQFMQGISGTMYDAMLLDQNWSAVEAHCAAENGERWKACHIPAGTFDYSVTHEVVAAVVSETGGLKEDSEGALALQDESVDPAASTEAIEPTAEDYEAAYEAEIDDGYKEVYGEMLSQVSQAEPNPETFIWMGAEGDNPCSDPKYGSGVRFVRHVEGYYNEVATICFNPDTGLVSTSVDAKYSYDYGDRIVSDSYNMRIDFDPNEGRSTMESSYLGEGYSYSTNLTLVESEEGLTITSLASYDYDGYKSSMRQTAFVYPNGNGYLETDEDLSYFAVDSATADFTTASGAWYSIYPAGADPQVVGAVGGFQGNDTQTPEYPSYWGPSSNLTGLDAYLCENVETTESLDGVDYVNWIYQCTLAGHVDLSGSSAVYRYRYKEFFGEQTGWQVIDPDSGEILYASDSTYQDAAIFEEYEAVTEDAVSATKLFDVSVSYSNQTLADLTDEDFDDLLDPSYGTFYIAACNGSCAAEVSEDGESIVLSLVGYSYLTYDGDGNVMVEDYEWGELSPDTTYGLYYYDYGDINDAGYPKAKLVSGAAVTVTAME